MNRSGFYSFAVASMLICASKLWSGFPQQRARFTMTDSKGHEFTLTFGTDTAATDGFDFTLGELPIPPPPPPNIPELRFLDRPGHPRVPGDGAYVDIRPFRSEVQVDTFVVRFQAAVDAYPLDFRWDAIEGCDSMVVEIRQGEGLKRIDMAARTSFLLSGPGEESSFIIIKYGARKFE